MEEKTISVKRLKLSKPSIQVNPFLVDLVLGKLIQYCKTSKEKWTSLSNHRLVCKAWDRNLVKLIRQDIEIDLSRLISPYPEGLGWTEIDSECGYHYECSYTVAPFENILVQGSCETLKDPKVIRWFQKMGSTVKRLRFVSPLTCYHHIRFLECVLKLWCINLKTLYLDGVSCIFSLIHNSKFVNSSDTICDLKEVIISVEPGDGSVEPLSLFCNCQADLPAEYLNFDGTDHILVPDNPGFRAIGLRLLKRVSRDFQGGISDDSLEFIRKTSGSDGGILGQVLKNAAIEKFWVKKLSTEYQCQDFLTFLNVRPILMRQTLTHFEYDNFSLAVNAMHLEAFRILKFPLTSIRLGMLFAFQVRNALRGFLASFADTLEHLEVSGNVVLQDWATDQEEEFIELLIPLLPKVRTFVNGNIFACRLGGLEFMRNLPSLEKCILSNTIYHSSIYPLTPSEVFNILFQIGDLDETHPLKELHLEGKICYSSHVKELNTWFPTLRKVELILEETEVFVEFLTMAKSTKLEDVKISFHANDNEWCNAGIVNNISQMSNLRFLELIHLTDLPLTISQRTCEQGFARVPNLTSLKLTNFAMFADEVEAIRVCLQHISCVKFSKTVLQHKPVDVEFSVGVVKSFPFVTA